MRVRADFRRSTWPKIASGTTAAGFGGPREPEIADSGQVRGSNGRTCGFVLGVFALLATFGAPSAPPAELAVVLHSPSRGVTAALRLTDANMVAAEEFSEDDTVFVARLHVAPAADEPSDPQALGQAFGTTAALALLEAQVPSWTNPRFSSAVAVTFDGASAFEGYACRDCVAVARTRVAVASAGLRRDVVARLARRLEAVDADPVDALLALAEEAAEHWPHRDGPKAGMVVAKGGERAREAIAVDRHGAVGRRLVERHLRHLADIELPRQLEAAKQARTAGEAEELRRRRTLGLALAARVIAAYPHETKLLDLRAELEYLR